MNVLAFSGISQGMYYEQKYGVRFVGHDSAVVLIQNGKILFAVEEERLTREKHTSSLPVRAINWGLESVGMSIEDIDVISYTWNATPMRKFHMYLHHPFRIPIWHWPALATAGRQVLRDLMSPRRVVESLENELGKRLPRIHPVSHHMTHGACAFFTSPFEEAAVLTVDGQGEDESATLGFWQGNQFKRYQSIYSPDSIGILYGMVTDFLGMRSAWDEYKVMGMASLGDSERFAKHFERLVFLQSNGRYKTSRTAMVFKPGYCDRYLASVFGISKRDPTAPLEQIHFDLAASLQAALERVLFHLLHRLRRLTESPNLCLAGGVFLNSVANGKIRNSGIFDEIHIPPVPGDHGSALGAAASAYYDLSGDSRRDLEFSPFLGPGYTDFEIEEILMANDSEIQFYRSDNIVDDAAKLLVQNKIIAWFQGKMEYGPRALGHRSILANPTISEMKDIVNQRIKHREEFRPFAGAVPIEFASDYFEILGESPHMQFVLQVREHALSKIPAVIHQGTCRVQTVSRNSDALFHGLICAFGERTGVPILLNTSFNDRDEPIVCSPNDALRTFLNTDLDALVIGPFVATKSSV
jgi:carbamoyltransferase